MRSNLILNSTEKAIIKETASGLKRFYSYNPLLFSIYHKVCTMGIVHEFNFNYDICFTLSGNKISDLFKQIFLVCNIYRICHISGTQFQF